MKLVLFEPHLRELGTYALKSQQRREVAHGEAKPHPPHCTDPPEPQAMAVQGARRLSHPAGRPFRTSRRRRRSLTEKVRRPRVSSQPPSLPGPFRESRGGVRFHPPRPSRLPLRRANLRGCAPHCVPKGSAE